MFFRASSKLQKRTSKVQHYEAKKTRLFNLLFLCIFFNQFFPPTLFTKSGNTATSPQQKRNSWIISLVVRKPTARPDYAHWHKVANADWLQPLWCASNVLGKHFNNSDYKMLEKITLRNSWSPDSFLQRICLHNCSNVSPVSVYLWLNRAQWWV